jgi:hypothetical protein
MVWMFRLGGFVIASTLRVQPWVAIELCIGAQCLKRWLRRSRCRVSGRCQVVSAAVRSRIRATEQVDLPHRSVRSGQRDGGTFVSGQPEGSGRSAIDSQVSRTVVRSAAWGLVVPGVDDVSCVECEVGTGAASGGRISS